MKRLEVKVNIITLIRNRLNWFGHIIRKGEQNFV